MWKKLAIRGHISNTYPSCKPSDPITEFDVDIVDLEVVPGAREKSVVLSPPSLSKFGNFHWFKRDCWPPLEFWKLFGGSCMRDRPIKQKCEL